MEEAPDAVDRYRAVREGRCPHCLRRKIHCKCRLSDDSDASSSCSSSSSSSSSSSCSSSSSERRRRARRRRRIRAEVRKAVIEEEKKQKEKKKAAEMKKKKKKKKKAPAKKKEKKKPRGEPQRPSARPPLGEGGAPPPSPASSEEDDARNPSRLLSATRSLRSLSAMRRFSIASFFFMDAGPVAGAVLSPDVYNRALAYVEIMAALRSPHLRPVVSAICARVYDPSFIPRIQSAAVGPVEMRFSDKVWLMAAPAGAFIAGHQPRSYDPVARPGSLADWSVAAISVGRSLIGKFRPVLEAYMRR
eukprot:tig00000492_g1445.t1